MDNYRSGMSERYASNNRHHINSLQQDKEYEHLKDVEHQREQLEKKYDELRLKHSEIEQREKDLRMKMALDAYEQLCLNIGNEGRSSIRQLLVNLCQAEFERNFEVQLMLKARSKKIAQADKEVRSELESLFEKEFQFAQIRAQGNIWLIGELYNYGILSDNMVLHFISRLLDEPSDVSWLWLCELILTVHTSLVKNGVVVDKYFMKIREIFKSKTQLSNNSETLLQNIILEWEAKMDPESIAALADEKVPDSEPIMYKPVVYTVQSYDKPNQTDHKLFREFNNKHSRGGKSRGRYRPERNFGNSAHSLYNRPPAYSSIVPLPINTVDGYNDWYEQNMFTAYGLSNYRQLTPVSSDAYAQYGMRPVWAEQDTREQKPKKKSRQQQNQNKNQESNSTMKKELLDGEMRIGFRKQMQKKSAENGKKSAVHQGKSPQHSATTTNKQVPAKKSSAEKESASSPQHKLWNALGVKVEDERECTDQDTTCKNKEVPAEVAEPKIESSEISTKTGQSDDDDEDVLILLEISENAKKKVECCVESGGNQAASVSCSDDKKSDNGVAYECSSETSEYSSPMESPVLCESKDKPSEIWSRLALLPLPKETTPTTSDAEKAQE